MNQSKVGECTSCQCTEQGSIQCKYLDATVCRNVTECEKVLITLPKRKCSYCVGSAPKVFYLSNNKFTLSCFCTTLGHFDCSYSKLIGGIIEYNQTCSDEECTRLYQKNGTG